MNPVIHFELPVEKSDRARKFYETVFGWQTTQLGAEAGNFILAFTTETDENRAPKKPGAINGGFYQKTNSEQHTKLTILVEDIRAAMRNVKDAGATLIPMNEQNPEEPFELPGVGLFATFKDTEGNEMSIYEDRSNKQD